MKVLALDTTTPRGSLAVVDGEELLGEVRVLSQAGHSARLLPAVAFLLEGLGLKPTDLDGFAVALGPGSFTGLRVGISTAQGLALAAGRPSLGLSSLDVLAHRIRGSAELLVSMVDAYREEVFTATYDSQARRLSPQVVAAPEAVLDGLPAGSLAAAGDGAQRYRERIRARRPDALFPDRSLFLAGTLARLAEPRLAAGEGGDPEALRPLYLREAAIRRPANLMTGLEAQSAGLEDLAALTDLEQRCHSHPWSQASFREALQARDRSLVLVLRAPEERLSPDRGLRAYCVIESVADEAHIHNLAVAPEHRRRGLGRRLLSLALEAAAGRGMQVAFLEVRASNQAALALYRELGFAPTGIRRGYYLEPFEDAIVLSRGAARADPGAGEGSTPVQP